MKKRLALLCALMLLVQLVTVPGLLAGAEDITTPSDLTHVHHGTITYDDTEHWSVCDECGEDFDRSEHYAKCTNPTICWFCKAEGVTMSWLWHNFDVRHYSDTECWYVCPDCGEEFDRQQHIAVCTNPSVCANCRQAGVTISGVAHNRTEYGYNDTEHWSACEECGMDVDRGEHYAKCTNPTTCWVCKAEGVTMSWLWHNFDVRHYSDTECWDVCLDCDEEFNRQPHIAFCTAPDVCVNCGQTCVTDHVAHWGEREIQYNNTECWEICKDCGSEMNRWRHYGACDDATTCLRCKQTGVTLDGVQHSYVQKHDAKTHWYACEGCGDTYSNIQHWAYCDMEANTCKGCGATDVTVARVEHQEGTYQHDQLNCWLKCDHCGEIYNKNRHWGYCSDGGKCGRCGATGVKLDFIDHEWPEEYEHNATTHWGSCMECGEKVEGLHEAYCDEPTTCIFCGGTGVTIDDELFYHPGCDWEKPEYNDFEHWYTCTMCGENIYADQHASTCTHPDVCVDCGATGVSMGMIRHEEVFDMARYGYDNDNHWWTCQDCGQKLTEKHSFDDGVMDACNVCGAEVEAPAEPTPTAAPTAAPTEAPTAEPTAAPTEAPTAEPTVAPTEAPTAEPTAEPTAKPTVVPPMKPAAPTAEPTAEPEHVCVFDAAFVSNGDGTHSKVCQESCGNTITESCPLVTMDTELMLCKVCPICGYTSYSVKENAGALAVIEQAPATVMRVEAAAVAAADEGSKEAVPENAVLIVHEATFDVPVTLPDSVQGTVEKVFTATLIKDEQSIQPSGKVRLSIPVDAETAAAMEGKKLMLLREDGTLLEIEYEIIDGQIVFITEELGVFLLMEGISAE